MNMEVIIAYNPANSWNVMNCVKCVVLCKLYIYRGIDNTCFPYMWREYMVILQHVMLHVIQYMVEFNSCRTRSCDPSMLGSRLRHLVVALEWGGTNGGHKEDQGTIHHHTSLVRFEPGVSKRQHFFIFFFGSSNSATSLSTDFVLSLFHENGK